MYVYWRCDGREDLSRVRDMSLGGLFIETPGSKALGTPTDLHFLVSEGQIRADALVRHVQPGVGVGLKFTAINDQDRRVFATLMKRLRTDTSTTSRLPKQRVGAPLSNA